MYTFINRSEMSNVVQRKFVLAMSRKHLHYEYIFANICKQPTCLYSLRLHVWKDVEKEKKMLLKDISIKHKHSLSMLHTFTDKQ